MSKLVDQLLLVLNKEQEIYDEIIKMSNDKQDAIVKSEIKNYRVTTKSGIIRSLEVSVFSTDINGSIYICAIERDVS